MMTVRELIDELQTMQQDAVVVFSESKFSSHESVVGSGCNRGGGGVVLYGSSVGHHAVS